MSANLRNLAGMSVSGTPGTGTITLGSALTNLLSFTAAGVTDGDTVTYSAKDGSATELGRGTAVISGSGYSADTFDPSNKTSGITLSSGNTVATHSSGTNQIARGLSGFTAGKKFFAATVSGGVTNLGVGLVTSSFVLGSTYLGGNTTSVAWYFNGNVVLNGAILASYYPYAAGDTVHIAVDLDADLIWFRTNANNWNNSGTANPATGVGGLSISGLAGTITYGAVDLDGATDAATIASSATVPSGFSWFGPASGTTTQITNRSVLKSTNSNALVSLTSSAEVRLVAAAEDFSDLPAQFRPPSKFDNSTFLYSSGNQWLDQMSGILYRCNGVSTTVADWSTVVSGGALLGAGYVLPVDVVGSAAAAYGVRLLRSGYTGYCMKVRRASDSTTKDIGFVNGHLDVAALDAFAVGTTAYVDTWYDQSGNGRHATQATTGSQPIMHGARIGGLRMPSFTGQLSTDRWLDVPTSVSLPTQNSSIVGVATSQLSYYNGCLVEMPSGASTMNLFAASSTGLAAWNTAAGGSTGIVPMADLQVFGHHASGTSTTVQVGNEKSTLTSATSATLTGGKIGKSFTAGYGFQGDIGCVIFFSTVLTSTQQDDVRASLSRLFVAPPQADELLVLDGDSITAGQSISTTLTFTNQVYAFIGRPKRTYNLGISGEQLGPSGTAGTMLNRYPSRGRVLATAQYPSKILFLLGGINDILNNARTGSSIYTDITSYVALAKADGYKVVVGTTLPTNNAGSSPPGTGRDVEIAALNTLVRANTAGADAIADFAGDPIIGASTAPADTTLYLDGLHPTQYGYSIMARIAADAINFIDAAPLPRPEDPYLDLDYGSLATLFPLLRANSANVAYTNGTSAQQWFPTQGAVTVQGTTTYLIDALLLMTNGTTSHTVGLSFTGTATLTNIAYVANAAAGAANSTVTTGNTTMVTQASNTVVTAAITTAGTQIRVTGIVRVNAGGTFIPNFTFSAAPGAGNVLANTYFRLTPLGEGSITSIGTWA